MDVQVWSKSQEKRARVLALRGNEVSLLTLTGNMFTLKKKLKEAVEAISAGRDPSELGIGSVKAIDVATIAKAQVSPGNDSITLHGGPDGSSSLSFSAADNDAADILRAILARAGRPFQAAQEEIGVVEALVPPTILGALGGLFWLGIYDAAGKLDAGQAVEVRGRRQGLRQLLVGVADVLGTTGTVVVGALLLTAVLGWAFRRITKRPERTVWLPATA